MICTRGRNTMSTNTGLCGDYYTNYAQYTCKFVILSALYGTNLHIYYVALGSERFNDAIDSTYQVERS